MTVPLAPELEPFGYITPSADGTWTPAQPGDELGCCLLQVWGCDRELLDVVAWRFGQPSPWWLRWGYVNFLGWTEIARALSITSNLKPTRLVATPAEWLADGGEAICILNWDAPLLPLLNMLGEITCTSRDLENRLRAALVKETGQHIRIRGAA